MGGSPKLPCFTDALLQKSQKGKKYP